MKASLRDRFNAKWIPHPRRGCWIWIGAKDPDGYGYLHQTSFPKRVGLRAHRASWIIHNGPISDTLSVLHRCDNPMCVNPEHLFLGTTADNIKDMNAKGRARGGSTPGSLHPNSKLREQDVLEIISSELPQKILAMRYGINVKYVSALKRNNKFWKHVRTSSP